MIGAYHTRFSGQHVRTVFLLLKDLGDGHYLALNSRRLAARLNPATYSQGIMGVTSIIKINGASITPSNDDEIYLMESLIDELRNKSATFNDYLTNFIEKSQEILDDADK